MVHRVALPLLQQQVEAVAAAESHLWVRELVQESRLARGAQQTLGRQIARLAHHRHAEFKQREVLADSTHVRRANRRHALDHSSRYPAVHLHVLHLVTKFVDLQLQLLDVGLPSGSIQLAALAVGHSARAFLLVGTDWDGWWQ